MLLLMNHEEFPLTSLSKPVCCRDGPSVELSLLPRGTKLERTTMLSHVWVGLWGRFVGRLAGQCHVH
jgi:hypothetical protein